MSPDGSTASPDDGSAPPVGTLLVLAAGVLATSTSAIFARLAAEAPPLVLAAFRCTAASLVLVLVDRRGLRAELARWDARTWGLVLAAGVLLAAHFASWLAALVHSSVASAVFLVNTTPLWVGLLAPFVVGDRLDRAGRIALVLGLLGSAVIARAAAGGGRDTPEGALLALVGALTLAVSMLISRRVGRSVRLHGYLVVSYGSAALVLLAAMLVTGESFVGYAPPTYLWLVALALVPQLMGHSVCNWALRRLPASSVALAFLGEPLVTSALAVVVLGELPPTATWIGGPLVLLGILLPHVVRWRAAGRNA